jgi:ribosome assembly protein SQT1
MTISWAIHRLNGISCPASAAYTAPELAFQLKNSGAKCIFTCAALLPIACKAAEIASIPANRIYLCPVAQSSASRKEASTEMKTLDDLISKGKLLPALENMRWTAGQGKRQTAFICYSSGTSGLPVRTLTKDDRCWY